MILFEYSNKIGLNDLKNIKKKKRVEIKKTSLIIEQDSLTLHISVLPHAFIYFSLSPLVFAIPMLQALLILSYIGTNHFPYFIVPGAHSIAMHFTIHPFTFVFVKFTLWYPNAMYCILFELSFIKSSIRISKSAFSLFKTIQKLSYITWSILIALCSLAALDSINPLTFVWSFKLQWKILSLTVWTILAPFSIVIFAVFVN